MGTGNYCHYCGAPLYDSEERICPHCHHDVSESPSSESSSQNASQQHVTVKYVPVGSTRRAGMPTWAWVAIAAIVVAGLVAMTWILMRGGHGSNNPETEIQEYDENVHTNLDVAEEDQDTLQVEELEYAEEIVVGGEAAETAASAWTGNYSWSGYFYADINEYPIGMTMTVSADGHVKGRYWYDSTIRKYGTSPSSYLYFTGTVDDYGNCRIDVKEYNKTDVFELWSGKLNKNGFEAEIVNCNTGNVFSAVLQ